MTAVRALVATSIAALWLALFVPPMFMFPPSAVTGVHFVPNGSLLAPNRIRVDDGSPAYRAGLRSGDVLGCLSLRDAHILLVNGAKAGYAGAPISTCVRRDGKLRYITFVGDAGPAVSNIYGTVAGAVMRIAVVLVFFATGIALVVLRPGLTTWLFFGYAIGSAPAISIELHATIWPAWLFAFAIVVTYVGAFSAGAFLLLFSIAVPDHNVPTGWRRKALLAALPLAVGASLYTAWRMVETSGVVSTAAHYLFDDILTPLTIVVVLTRLLTMGRLERARFGWAAFAIIAGVVANYVRSALGAPPHTPYGVIAGYATIVMPLCLGYAILKQHVIDVRFAISRTVVYAVLTSLVVCVVGAVDWATSAFLHQARLAMALDALVTIGVVFALSRVHHWLENGVDFLIFRKKYQAEHFLIRLGRTLLSATQQQTVDRALVRDPYERFELTFAALFRDTGRAFLLSSASSSDAETTPSFEYEHDLVRFLRTEHTRLRLGDLTHHAFGKSAIAIPIFEGRDLTGFVVYGLHRDGTNLDPDEIATLERLCEAAAQAYTYIELRRYRAQVVSSPAV
jgi:hypothetical protein